MAKVTSKYQVTLPKAIAKQYDIHPGDEIDWVPAGDVIRVIPPRQTAELDNLEARLRLFDQASERVREKPRIPALMNHERGWKREDLYTRGRSR